MCGLYTVTRMQIKHICVCVFFCSLCIYVFNTCHVVLFLYLCLLTVLYKYTKVSFISLSDKNRVVSYSTDHY